MLDEKIERLLDELNKLHEKNLLFSKIDSTYFEPGMMEYLDQFDGVYDSNTGAVLIRFESKGTRYDGRTEQIEHVKIGDEIQIVRDSGNEFNSNNFTLLTKKSQSVGNMPAELCNAIAPLFDESRFIINSAKVSFVEPISKRNRHAKQAILFVELSGRIV